MALALPVPSEDLQPGIKVAELLRVSTEEQAEETRAGLARQKAVNERTILTKGLTRVICLELHVSGTVMANHPQVKALLDMVARRQIDGVVCADLDRLFRPDNFHSYSILQTFQDYGARIYTGDSVYDLQTSNGLLQSSIRSAISGFELSLIRERLHGAKEAKRRAGKFPGCWKNLPSGVGYDRQTETWHYTPEIVRVKELFDRFEAGERNYSALGREFGFCQITVKNLLRNPIYTGWRIIDQKRGAKRVSATGKHYRVKVKRAPEDIIRVKVLEGIISVERHAAILQEMATTKFNFMERYRSEGRIHLCSGLLTCGHCGSPMYVLNGKRGKAYIACRANYYLNRKKTGGCRQTNLREDHMEEALVRLVQEVLSDPNELAQILEASIRHFQRTVTPFASAIDSATQLEDLTRRDRRLLDAFEGGAITLDELKTKRDSIRRQRTALERSIQPTQSAKGAEILEHARVIVKGALRFSECQDRYHQKKIISELLGELHVRDTRIIGFKLKPSLCGTAHQEAVTLSEPRWIGPKPDLVPAKHARCIKCHEVKREEEFYRGRNQCRTCLQEIGRGRYRKKRVLLEIEAMCSWRNGSPPEVLTSPQLFQ